MYKRIPKFLLLLSFSTFALIGFSFWKKSSQAQSDSAKKKAPNIVMLIADDMGYSDVGAFGGEISTPNIDALARGGMKFTNFHAGAACSPSRSMMLTGIDNHLVGLGTMAEDLTERQKGNPGYEGYLNDRVVTLPTLLKDAGYNTYMVGKWHLGHDEGHFPSDKGFTQSFSLIQGAATHFSQMGYSPGSPIATYKSNGKDAQLPANFYSTDFYTNKLIEFINQNRRDNKPFFIYGAFTSPHDPLQAPQQYIRKYMGKYDIGWDRIREQRFQRLKQLGIIPNNLQLPPRQPGVPAWDSLTPEKKRYNAKLMAIYAGMVDNLDTNIGRLIAHLKSIGEYENTIFVFMSDNGAAAHDFAAGHKEFEDWFKKEGINNSYENIGNKNSFVAYGEGWADVSATPHYGFKGRVYEGGIRVPAIFYYPKAIKAGTKTTAFASVMDFMPTFLDYAGFKHPGTNYQGRPILPMNGRSLRPLLEGKAARIYGENDAIGFELFGDGNRALFMGDWKVLRVNKPRGDNQWKLFNIAQDPRELVDLGKQYPDKLNKMISLYEQYEKDKGVVYFDDDPDKVFDRGL
ncbi:arylsulfatase [Aerosakkonema funiforme]|uniref:Arylsulfatase n=2 Tax=Oscillatoriophycideae TaxID=1301283 RepID=A0A926VE55_9CYAN|nr:arylsulfatase [Aerosakkonema funiforme]MBD2181608.1 arylsulfatase [Aerosakkonema funiforme FACHB-1375]